MEVYSEKLENYLSNCVSCYSYDNIVIMLVNMIFF